MILNIKYSGRIGDIFSTKELDSNSVIKEFLITAADGKNYKTKMYNLEAITAPCNGVGPRELSDMAELLIILSSEIITSFSRAKNLLSANR